MDDSAAEADINGDGIVVHVTVSWAKTGTLEGDPE